MLFFGEYWLFYYTKSSDFSENMTIHGKIVFIQGNEWKYELSAEREGNFLWRKKEKRGRSFYGLLV